MTVVHTSDWHLGAKLHDQDRADEHAEFLKSLVSIVQSEGADAVVISGDVFDMRQPGPAAQALYYDFLAAIDQCPTCKRVIVTAGNHDSSSMLSAAGRALKRIGVEVVAKASEDVSKELVVLTKEDGTPGLVVAAVPFMNSGELSNFARAASVEANTTAEKLAGGFKAHYQSVLAAAKDAAQGAPILAMGHCAVAGAKVSDTRSERGRTVGGLEEFEGGAFEGADYVALGHLHIPQLVNGDGRVAYCGSPLQMSFSEVDERKYVNIVRFGETAGAGMEVVAAPIDATVPLKQFEGTTKSIGEMIRALIEEKPEKVYLSIRVTEGEGELAGFWHDVDAKVQGTGIRVLLKENARPHAVVGTGLAAASERELSAMTPLEVATLRINEETDLSQEERDGYVKMVEKVVEEVK